MKQQLRDTILKVGPGRVWCGEEGLLGMLFAGGFQEEELVLENLSHHLIMLKGVHIPGYKLRFVLELPQ
jgi:hypothetical protein